MARLRETLLRLPVSHFEALQVLARETRIRQSDFLREAVADLLVKYRAEIERGRASEARRAG